MNEKFGFQLKSSLNSWKYFVFLASVFLLPACSVKQQLKKADKKYDVGEYHTASTIYNRVYPKVKVKDRSTKAYAAFKLGNCYRLLNIYDRKSTKQ